MIKGVKVTFWMLLKHLFGIHTEYVHTIERGGTVYWNGGFVCAVCGKKSQAIEPQYEPKDFK